MTYIKDDDKELISWLKKNLSDDDSNLNKLLSYIVSHANSLKEAALRPGDTDYAKGRLSGLLFLNELIIKLTETDTGEETG